MDSAESHAAVGVANYEEAVPLISIHAGEQFKSRKERVREVYP